MPPPQQIAPFATPPLKEHNLPAAIANSGPAAIFAWDEFFSAHIRNAHTRAAYLLAVRRFLAWLPIGIEIPAITPGMVGEYFNRHSGGPATRKLHLAAIRGFFDLLVTRHITVINPALSVRSERYQVIEGKTPEITIEQARQLLASIATHISIDSRQVIPLLTGLRDKAVIATLIYTAARAGAVAKLRRGNFNHDGTQWTLRFDEKGQKSREIPVRHDLELLIRQYLIAAELDDAPPDTPFFRSALGKTGRLTSKPMTGVDICRLVKRRLKAAGLPNRLSPHSFRVATVTDLLSQGVPLEDVQYLAGHADARTTRLYDRRQRRVTRNIVERISI